MPVPPLGYCGRCRPARHLRAGPGRTRLILYSEQRLSTRLNPYAGLWTDYVMSEIQRRILEVIRRRCEADARAVARH